MLKKASRLFLAFAIIGGSGGALADGNPTVKARKGLMNLYAHYVSTLGGMAKGAVEYDQEKAAGAANSLQLLASSLDQSGMWTPGTSNAELGEETRALPVIWSTYPAVMEKAKALNEAAAAMSAAAGQDLPSLQAAMKGVGDACGGCHKDYRQPKG